MSNFLLDFLPTVGAVAGGVLGEVVDPFGGGIVGAGLGSALGKAGENVLTGQGVGKGVIGAAAGGAVGQGVGGLAAKGLEAVGGAATSVGGKIATGAAKGAVVGGSASTAGAVASGQPITGKNLSMDFIQGAAIGGLTGGGISAFQNRTLIPATDQAGALNPNRDVLSDDAAARAAKEQDPAKVEKILAEETGPKVAQDVAPAVATTSQGDPDIVKNIVKNDITGKLRPASPYEEMRAKELGITPQQFMDKQTSTPSPSGLQTTTLPQNNLVPPTPPRFANVNELLQAIDVPKAGRQGLAVSNDEFQQVNDLFQNSPDPETQKWRGTIMKQGNYRGAGKGEEDLVLGRVNGDMGTHTIVAEMQNGRLTGLIRSHATPLSDDPNSVWSRGHAIVGKVDLGNPTSLPSGMSPENNLTSVEGGATIEGKGRGVSSSNTALNANNQLLTEGQKLNTAPTNAPSSTLRASIENVLGKKGTPTRENIEEQRTGGIGNQEIPQNSGTQSALSAGQPMTSNLPTSNPSGLAEGTSGQSPFAGNTTTPLTTSSETSGPATNVNTPAQVTQQATAAEANFINAPGETGATHVGKASALQDAQYGLNSGRPVTDIANDYLEKSGASIQQTKSDIDNLIQNSSPEALQKGNVNSSLNPKWDQVSVPPVAEGDRAGALGRPNALNNEGVELANAAQEKIDALSENDLSILRQIRNTTPDEVLSRTKADNPAAIKAAAEAKKEFYDWDQAVGSKLLGRDVPYRQDYYGGLQLAPEEEPGGGVSSDQARLPTNPGFAKGQNFLNYEDAAQNGVKPQFENDSQDFYADSARRLNGIQQLALHSGLDEAYPGQVNVGRFPAGSKQLLIPGGSKITLPAELANPINERAAVTPTGALAGYDKLNNNFKYLKLGGGTFHLFNELGNFAAQQIASGKAFSDPSGMSNVFKSIFSQDTFNNAVSEFRQNGQLMAMDLMHLTRDAPQLSQDIGPKGLVGRIPVLKQLYDATFGRAIPMMKMQSMAQWMNDNGIDAQNLTSEDVQNGTKYALQINKTYGGLDRMIQGLTPAQFKVISRGFLATDWTEAQLNTLMDAFRAGGQEGKLARQVVFGKALLFGGLATAGGGLGGEFKNKTPIQVAEDIIGKTINPSFKIAGYNVGFPETQISEFAKPLTGTVSNIAQGKSAATPVENFAKARLSAPLSEGLQLATNKDFYGNPIHGTDFYGRPISPGQTASSLASGVLPIPASQGLNTASGKQNVGAAIANTVGFHASPQYDLSYSPLAGQTYVQQLEKTPGIPQAKIDSTTEFFDLLGKGAKGKNKVLLQAESAIKAGDTQKANQVIQDYNQKLSKALLPWEQDGGTKYLDTNMLQLLRTAEITYSKANKQVAYTTKTNPTAIGAQIQALSSAPQPVK